MKCFLLGVVVGALLWYILIEADAAFVESFIAREQMTVRPAPRWRPR